MGSLCGIVRFDGGPVEVSAAEALARRGVGALEVASLAGQSAAMAIGRRSVGDGPAQASDGTLATAVARFDGSRRQLEEAALRCRTLQPSRSDGTFSSSSLLLAAAGRWGVDFGQHLEGAFAGAVWQPKARRLILVRDPIGERPLFWTRRGDELAFASDPIGLAHLAGAGEVDLRALLAYLLSAPPLADWSFFAGVHRLPEGHRLVATAGSVRVEAQQRGDRDDPVDRSEAPRVLRQTLGRAVSRRLVKAGCNGVLLSGGLDSSAVAALAADLGQHRPRELKAFRWVSAEGDGIDETAISDSLLSRWPEFADHPIQADEHWPMSRFPTAYDDPNAPLKNSYPELLLATLDAARETGTETLMNGVGGDLVVGGHLPELALLRSGRLGALWHRLRRDGWRRSMVYKKVRGLRIKLPSWLTAEALTLVRDHRLDRHHLPWQALASGRVLRRLMLTSHENAANLERFDRLSRRHGVRIVAPWHDAELARLALRLPECGFPVGRQGKLLLRQAMQGLLPEEVLEPTRRPVPGLFQKGVLGVGRKRLEGVLSSCRLLQLGVVDRHRLLSDYSHGIDRNLTVPGLWRLITTEGWLAAREAAGEPVLMSSMHD